MAGKQKTEGTTESVNDLARELNREPFYVWEDTEIADLIKQLKMLTRHEHEDLSIGEEAADALREAYAEIGFLREKMADAINGAEGAEAEVERLRALLRELRDDPRIGELYARIDAELGEKP
jgi:aminopeptidase N